MPSTPPPIEFPPALAATLRTVDDGLPSRADAFLASSWRPTVRIRSERVADAPQRRGLLGRSLGLRIASPSLPVPASKFGGVPYADADTDWSGWDFLGQVNFEEVPVLDEPAPRRGILGIDIARSAFASPRYRTRWYPNPGSFTPRAENVRCVGRFEARMLFDAAWSLPEDLTTWSDALGEVPEEVLDAWIGWDLEHNDPDRCRMLGHLPDLESRPLDPVDGASADPADYVLALRVPSFDHAAGFSFGTSSFQVLAPRDDFADGRLERATVLQVNY